MSDDLLTAPPMMPESMRFVLRMVPMPWDNRPAEFPVVERGSRDPRINALADALAERIASVRRHSHSFA